MYKLNEHTSYQIIMQNGRPAFVVIPYEEFQKANLIANSEVDAVPHEVMRYVIKRGYSRVRAWREYLGLTQKAVATKMGITQAALSQIESPDAKPRKATLKKLAVALGVDIELLS